MWKAAAAAAGIDYGKDLAEKQIWKNWFRASWGASPPRSARKLRKNGPAV